MNPVSAVFILLGACLALLASIGLLRLKTPSARFHAAGKASPVAFLAISIGAAFEVGVAGAGELAIVTVALLLTLPASTHLLFRAVHRTTPPEHMSRDDLASAEALLAEQDARPADGH